MSKRILQLGVVGQGAVGMFVLQLGNAGMQFAQAVLIARLVGPEGYGAYAFTISIIAVLALLATGGFAGLSIRQLARQKHRALDHAFIRHAHFATLSAALAAALLLLAVALVAPIDPLIAHCLPIAAAILPVAAFLLLDANMNQGLGSVTRAQAPILLVRPLLVLLAIVLGAVLGFQWGAPTLVAAFGLASVIGLAVAIRTLREHLSASHLRPGRRAFRLLRRRHAAGIPFLLVALLAILTAEVQTLMLGVLAGPNEAGLFQPVARASVLLTMPAVAISAPLMARVAALWAKGEHAAIRSLSRKATVAAFSVTASIGVLLALLADFYLALFGSAFASVRSELVIVVLGQVVFVAFGMNTALLNYTRGARFIAASTTLALVVQVALGAAFVPQLGIAGAVTAMVAGQLVLGTTNALMVRRLLGIKTTIYDAALELIRARLAPR